MISAAGIILGTYSSYAVSLNILPQTSSYPSDSYRRRRHRDYGDDDDASPHSLLHCLSSCSSHSSLSTSMGVTGARGDSLMTSRDAGDCGCGDGGGDR